MLFKKNKEKFYSLKKHSGLCSAKICEETLKKIQSILIDDSNIREWENRLDRCNRCYIDKKNTSILNRLTRGTISAEINFYRRNYKK